MYRRTTPTLTAMALVCLAVTLPGRNAAAQQKEQVSYKAPAENSKVTQQQNIDVGDVPNHIVRSYEVHRTYPTNPPVINGLKLIESWDRGTTDLIDGNGGSSQYSVYVMENGDRFVARMTNVVQSSGGKLTATGVGPIVSGTGKLAAMQGTVRIGANFDLKAGTNDGQGTIEYSIGK